MRSTPYMVSRAGAVTLLAAPVLLIASAAIAVPAELTLDPADPTGTLSSVRSNVALHLLELALDVLGWLALLAAGILVVVRETASRQRPVLLAGGLLASAGLAGLLHDAGNLAATQLAADPGDPTNIAAARAVLLTAKWGVNLAGLLWVAATAVAVAGPLSRTVRIMGVLAVVSGMASVVLPWTAGTSGLSPALEQLGYLLYLPVMAWWAVIAGRDIRRRH